MAYYRVSECDADMREEGDPFTGPEEKYVFNARNIYVKAGENQECQGFVATFANTGLIGLQDYYDPVTLGKPVVGNFIKPKRFDWKFQVKTQAMSANDADVISNSVTFRLIWLLLWEFPRDIVLSTADFLKLYLDNPQGDRHQSYLYPDVKEKCMVLYDCNHTLGSAADYQHNAYGNVVSAAGGQAAYVVPAPSGSLGWPVPAATVPATSTSLSRFQVSLFGGHYAFEHGSFDLEGLEMALWRDPEEEEEQQIVPALCCFVVCQDGFNYYPSATAFVASARSNVELQFFTRLAFTDE